jgi:hypothetical protein
MTDANRPGADCSISARDVSRCGRYQLTLFGAFSE